VVGSPAYLSPEQACGLVDEEIDGRSDLYSLGVVMYQMLSGDLPLKADSSAEFLNAHLNILPEPLQTRCPGVPKALAELVMSCLRKSREHRPGSAKDFIERLGHGVARVPAVPPT
jgi:serine/threonine-protein kinase